MIGPCASLSWQILELLLAAKGNRQDHKSLQRAITNSHSLLNAVPFSGVSAEGSKVLGEWCCGPYNLQLRFSCRFKMLR